MDARLVPFRTSQSADDFWCRARLPGQVDDRGRVVSNALLSNVAYVSRLLRRAHSGCGRLVLEQSVSLAQRLIAALVVRGVAVVVFPCYRCPGRGGARCRDERNEKRVVLCSPPHLIFFESTLAEK